MDVGSDAHRGAGLSLEVRLGVVGPLHWKAGDGNRAIDLHGSPGFGGIKQTFKTVEGRRYRVSFLMAGSPGSGSTVNTVEPADKGRPARRKSSASTTKARRPKTWGGRPRTWELCRGRWRNDAGNPHARRRGRRRRPAARCNVRVALSRCQRRSPRDSSNLASVVGSGPADRRPRIKQVTNEAGSGQPGPRSPASDESSERSSTMCCPGGSRRRSRRRRRRGCPSPRASTA